MYSTPIVINEHNYNGKAYICVRLLFQYHFYKACHEICISELFQN